MVDLPLKPSLRTSLKPIVWLSGTLGFLRSLPKEVRTEIGEALSQAQRGLKSPEAKPLRGFGGASVLEIVTDYFGDTYRTIYTVQFSRRIYVLSVFKKKSKHGIRTPKKEIDLIFSRLLTAEEDYEQWLKKNLL